MHSESFPFAPSNWGSCIWVSCITVQTVVSLGKLLCLSSQPWDSSTSAIWVKSVSVSTSFKNAIKKTKPFSSTKIEGRYQQNCHLITVFSPCNSFNLFWWRNPITRTHTALLLAAPAQESTCAGCAASMLAPTPPPLGTNIHEYGYMHTRNSECLNWGINHCLSWQTTKDLLPIWPSDMFSLGTHLQ